MLLKAFVFVVCVCLVCAQDDDDCEKIGKFNASLWESNYDFIRLPNGHQAAFLYTSDHTTTELDSEKYPEGTERNIAEFFLILLKGFEVARFQRMKSNSAVTWLTGHTVSLYVIDEVTGNLTTAHIGIGRQTFSYNLKGSLFAAKLKNPRDDKYAVLGPVDFPGSHRDDYESVSEDELLRLYPQHTSIIQSLYS